MHSSRSQWESFTTVQLGSGSVLITCTHNGTKSSEFVCNVFSTHSQRTVDYNWTLFFPCGSGVVEVRPGESSHCTVLFRSSQSTTWSRGSWNSTWQILHLINWLPRRTGSFEEKVTVTSLEQPAWMCPTCEPKQFDHHYYHILNSVLSHSTSILHSNSITNLLQGNKMTQTHINSLVQIYKSGNLNYLLCSNSCNIHITVSSPSTISLLYYYIGIMQM